MSRNAAPATVPWQRVTIALAFFSALIVSGVLLGKFLSRGDREERVRDEGAARSMAERAESDPARPVDAPQGERGSEPPDAATAPPPYRRPDRPAYRPLPQDAPPAHPGARGEPGSLAAAHDNASAGARSPAGVGSPASSRRSPDGSRGAVAASGPGRSEALVRVAQAPAADTREEGSRSEVETSELDDDPDSDRKPPTLLSLRMDPPEIADGNASLLTIEISDDLSGVQSVAGRFRSPTGAAMVPFEAQSPGEGNPFTAVIKIPASAETGSWYVSDFFASDRARNPLVANFTAATVPPGGTLLVTSPDSDSTPPVVRSVVVEDLSVGGGEKTKVRIEIDDDRSGVASIWGIFQSPSRSAVINFSCRPQGEGGPWEGIVAVPANADCGTWTLQQLWVADKAGNSVRLGAEIPALAGVSFEVSSDTCDATAPELEWIALAPREISNTVASEIELTASVRDDGTGTTSVFVSIIGPVATSGQAPRIPIQCTRSSNEPSAVWSGKIPVPQFAAKGTWRVALMRLEDGARNFRIYKSDDAALSQAVFEVR